MKSSGKCLRIKLNIEYASFPLKHFENAANVVRFFKLFEKTINTICLITLQNTSAS